MLDTIKFGIPLSRSQHEKISRLSAQNQNEQWVLFNPKTGDLRFVRHKGLFKCDQQSFRREIFWDIPESYIENDTYLTVELSLPKYWYGHNIHLLFDWYSVIEEIRKQFQKQLKCIFPNINTWKVWRADICYAWRCPSQHVAQSLLDSLKNLDFPRKKSTIYPDSILFAGTEYSFKFYLKYPEFIAHDRKALLKDNARLEWIEYLEKKASGVIRCEATLRRKYLQRQGINTIEDLNKTNQHIHFSDDTIENYPDIEDNLMTQMLVLTSILNYMGHTINGWGLGNKITLYNEILESNDGEYTFSAPSHLIDVGMREIEFKGGMFYVVEKPLTMDILSNLITKFIGSYKGLNNIEAVEEKIIKKYKKIRAAKLLGFYTYVSRKGIKRAKEFYGHDVYYRCKSDLKKIGVNLITPPVVINASDRFLKNFEFTLPNEYGTNQVDDYRDHDNLLNLPSQEEA